MTTTETKLTNCPTCGVKLPDIPLSLCAYCASPLGVQAKDTGGVVSPNAGRIERVRAHDKFAEAMEFRPPEGPGFVVGCQEVFLGQVLAGVGLAAVALGVAWSVGRDTLVPGLLLGLPGLALAVWGLLRRTRGARMKREALAWPLLRRPGVITDRRSDTSLRTWTGETTYYFEIEFEEGVKGEFRWPGRGINEEPYPSNLPGVAYTRGTELVHFQHIRV